MDGYLMQFQSDVAQIPVAVSPTEELSGMGAAYAAGCGVGLYNADKLFEGVERRTYAPERSDSWSGERRFGWQQALAKALSENR